MGPSYPSYPPSHPSRAFQILLKNGLRTLPILPTTSSEKYQKKQAQKLIGKNAENTILQKKDSSIKICGTPEAVKKAKEMLLNNMEMQSNRVTMKMDVTHLEHPSLIGKCGNLIKKVMENTGCHIHFPDVNKSLAKEKSNQVSISGEPTNVERARTILRALIPVQIFFDNPVSDGLNHVLNPFLALESKFIETELGLSMYLFSVKNGVVTIAIRCDQDQFRSQKQNILMLMEYICGKRGSELPHVYMVTDIMPYHHAFVKGANSSNIQDIMKRTGAKIVFPPLNASGLEKSSVKIHGSLDCVYMAWQEIMNFLPLCVAFDIVETRDANGEYVEFLNDCNITVQSRLKPKFHIKSVTIKGPEKFSRQMLQYRQHLLHLSALNFTPDIQDINLASKFLSSIKEHYPQLTENQNTVSLGALVSNNFCNQILEQINTTVIQEHSLNIPHTSFMGPSFGIVMDGENSQCDKNLIAKVTEIEGYLNRTLCDSVKKTETDFKSSSFGYRIPLDNEYRQATSAVNAEVVSGQVVKCTNWSQSAANQKASSSYDNMVLEQSSTFQSNTNYESMKRFRENSHVNVCSSFCSCEKCDGTLFSGIDYYHKKILATKAMRRPIESKESTQVPSSLWAGYGFSQSMPAAVIKDGFGASSPYSYLTLGGSGNNSSNSSSEDIDDWDKVVFKNYFDESIWSNKKENVFSHSNYFDFMPDVSVPLNDTSKNILPELLWQHGLHNYLDIFTKEEIDYKTFLLLNDEDLLRLGIGFQARMKLICLIRELQDTEMLKMKPRDFNAAPGAGRK
ncbi:protein bicaudal C homolog 1-like isoform X2 [Stegodyphus dumicola]|uniref:protein bicaudal C homolog 1-like isoform X2 n=1 Tax=Stegodyphus dumicola TaxID=202533 RepID=UPI0015AEDD51|nr:protein bicaudal C homolog 1-like isoform X2 [Stegodyphus dumicola]